MVGRTTKFAGFGAAVVSVAIISGGAVQAAEPAKGQDLAGRTVYLAPGAAIRSGPNLTDKIVFRADKWLAVKGRDACTFWNCTVEYNGQTGFARRSRLDLEDKSKPMASNGATGNSGSGSGGSGSGSSASSGGALGAGGALTRKLVRGDEGDDVKAVQEALVKKGFKIKVDGKYGSGTEDAVREFQEKNQLGPDGRVGPLTWEKLR